MPPAPTAPNQPARNRVSRPARLATSLVGGTERTLGENLFAGTVLIGIEPDLELCPDARLTLRTLCNQVLRFCPNVVFATNDRSLYSECQAIAVALYGDRAVAIAAHDASARATVRVLVGRTDPGDGTIVVNSTGWVARLASGRHGRQRILPWDEVAPNALGAIAAACLGAAHVFFGLIGFAAPAPDHELSMWTGETGPLGALDPGPDLPAANLSLDALLIGCGAVGSGWATAIASLPIAGLLGAVDRQPLASENIGPYALAMPSAIGDWKVDIIGLALAPAIQTRPYPEELNLFVPRITMFGEVALPPVVICGLDDPQYRHMVQRLWPETLIDLATGGATAQVLVHRDHRGGQCLLTAHTVAPHAIAYAERIVSQTGLRPERIVNDFTTRITEADVANAPLKHRPALEVARESGQVICSTITQSNLDAAADDDKFAPAAPFVAGLAGAMGSSMTVQLLMGRDLVSGLHWQYSFVSGSARGLTMSCPPECECHLRQP